MVRIPLSNQDLFARKLTFFLFLEENLRCGYSWEAPYWGASHEYPQRMISHMVSHNLVALLSWRYKDLASHEYPQRMISHMISHNLVALLSWRYEDLVSGEMEISYLSSGKREKLDKSGMVFQQPFLMAYAPCEDSNTLSTLGLLGSLVIYIAHGEELTNYTEAHTWSESSLGTHIMNKSRLGDMFFGLARRGSTIGFHSLLHTAELAMITRLCLL